MSTRRVHLILGLGNPGKEYAATYHNVGFLAVERLKNTITMTMTMARSGKERLFEWKEFCHSDRDSDCTVLARPLIFMNDSGRAVKQLLQKFKTKPEKILAIHDDSDIALGDYKLAYDRGAAGHNGVQSIINALGTKKFYRLRIGIRPTLRTSDVPNIKAAHLRTSDVQRLKAGDFVLKKITAAHKKILADVLTRAFQELTNDQQLTTNDF